jgi:hypothetical protein
MCGLAHGESGGARNVLEKGTEDPKIHWYGTYTTSTRVVAHLEDQKVHK